MEVAHSGFGSGLSAAIKRHHPPKPAIESNDRLEPAPPVEPGVHVAVRPRSRTRGVIELAVGVVGALMVLDGLWAWQRRRA